MNYTDIDGLITEEIQTNFAGDRLFMPSRYRELRRQGYMPTQITYNQVHLPDDMMPISPECLHGHPKKVE